MERLAKMLSPDVSLFKPTIYLLQNERIYFAQYGVFGNGDDDDGKSNLSIWKKVHFLSINVSRRNAISSTVLRNYWTIFFTTLVPCSQTFLVNLN